MTAGRDSRTGDAIAEVRIDSIAAGGDGVGRIDGLVVFVPRTAPGDLALVQIESRGRFARGKVLELLERSPSRTEPSCAHYVVDRCGGCQLQHLHYATQLEAKSRIVGDALARIARRGSSKHRAPGAEQLTLHASPSPWRYREKLTLALRRRGTDWIAGLHPYNSSGNVFALRDCPITDERVLSLWREILSAGEFLPRASALRGAVRVSNDARSFVLEGGMHWNTSERFFERVASLSALWWRPERKRLRRLHSRGEAAAPGASFAQVNPAVARTLWGVVLDRALARSPSSAIDAYSGLGDAAIALDSRGVAVTAIELDRETSAWCARRLSPLGRAVAGRVENVLPGVLPADVVILNPPRTGLASAVCVALEKYRGAVKSILYVSCDPATLARDLTRLPSYQIASLEAFDMFPQTAHVETVCELIPERE